MTQALDFVRSLILGLFYVIMAAIAWIEGFLRGLMTRAGVGEDLQKPVLVVVAALLILVALRLFGRVFGVLIAIFLLLLLLHTLLPGLSVPA
jgi:thiol:disulfide interchange protein